MSTASKVRITSSVKTDDVIFSHLTSAARELTALGVEVSVIPRKRRTIADFFREGDVPVIVISHQLPQLYFDTTSKIVYHENTTKFKLKAFDKRGELPPLVEAMATPLDAPLTIVDATMGMGNDLVLMATLLTESEFHAYESHPLIHYVISRGIQRFHPALSERIHFHYGQVDRAMLEQADRVYVDPMFEETIDQQSGMEVLHQALTTDDNTRLVHLLTVHARYVVLKAHFRSPLFSRFGFDVQVRRSTKSHFGIKKSRKRDLFRDHHADHIS